VHLERVEDVVPLVILHGSSLLQRVLVALLPGYDQGGAKGLQGGQGEEEEEEEEQAKEEDDAATEPLRPQLG